MNLQLIRSDCCRQEQQVAGVGSMYSQALCLVGGNCRLCQPACSGGIRTSTGTHRSPS